MKVTEEMLAAYANAFDRAGWHRTTERRRLALQAAVKELPEPASVTRLIEGNLALIDDAKKSALETAELATEITRLKAVHADTVRALSDEIAYLQRLVAIASGVDRIGDTALDQLERLER